MPDVFVYARREINLGIDLVIRLDDVGIAVQKDWANPNTTTCPVFFIRIWATLTIGKEDLHYFDPIATGDGFQNKVCNMCHRLLPTENFAKNQNGKDNRTVRRPSCQECRVHIDGKGLSLGEKRIWDVKKPYLKPFECPICGKRTVAGLTSKIVLDHNHKTGKARDWICDSCNTGIGRFKDDAELIKRALKFIEDL